MYTQEAREMFNLLNSYRNQSRIASLTWSSNLESLAKTRAKELEINYSHTRPNGGTILDIDSVYGENIGFASFKTPRTYAFYF